MARQINVSLSPVVFVSQAYNNATVTPITKSSEIQYNCFVLNNYNLNELVYCLFSPYIVPVQKVMTGISSVASTAVFPSTGNLSISFYKNQNTTDILSNVTNYFAGAFGHYVFAVSGNSTKKVLTLTTPNVINTFFYLSGYPAVIGTTFGRKADDKKSYSVHLTVPEKNAENISASLIATPNWSLVSVTLSSLVNVVSKIDFKIVPHVFSSNTCSDNGALGFFSNLTRNDNYTLSNISTSGATNIKFFLLSGPGKISNDGIWSITKAEFDAYSENLGYAFAKILISAPYTNPTVERVFLFDLKLKTFSLSRDIKIKKETYSSKSSKIEWKGPNVFRTRINKLLKVNLNNYIKATGTNEKMIDAIIASGPGYVLKNVYYFLPTRAGVYHVTLDVLNLLSGEKKLVEFSVHVADSSLQNKIIFRIYGQENELVKIPVRLLVANIEAMQLELNTSRDNVYLEEEIVCIRCNGKVDARLLIKSGEIDYMTVHFIR